MVKKSLPNGQVIEARADKPARFDFQPAELRINADKWRIEFWVKNPVTGEMERYRPTFNLNRITDEKERKKHAARILKKLNDVWLPGGYPHRSIERIEAKTRTIGEAFGAILKIKMASENYDTHNSYKSIGGVFMRWLEANKFAALDERAFLPRHALAYADYLLTERELGGRAFNNSINTLSGIWKVLIKREELEKNPWAAVDRRKNAPKKRRMFHPEERRFVAKWALEHDYFLFIAILFEFYGFIRWKEMRRLTFADVDISGPTAYVRFAAEKTKNGKKRTVTIPDSIRHYLLDPRFSGHPVNFRIFGACWVPGVKPAGLNALNDRHKKAIAAGVEAGDIENPAGLSMYSWKDTGVTIGLDVLDLMDVVGQADHADPRQTMTYNHKPEIIEGFKRRANDIFS